jgi:hypothetical protein
LSRQHPATLPGLLLQHTHCVDDGWHQELSHRHVGGTSFAFYRRLASKRQAFDLRKRAAVA